MNNPYGKIDNLSAFTHPVFNQVFRYMNDFESICMAKEILNKLIQSGYKNIIVIESGTSPLINIIQRLKQFKNSNLNLFQIKVPRDLNFDLLGWFNTYLTNKELCEIITINNVSKSRKSFLKEECKNFDLSHFIGSNKFNIYDSIADNNGYNYDTVANFQLILNGTNLSKIFNDKFLVFDEYINAGTIIRNFNGLSRLFTSNPNFKLSAFCIFVDDIKKYSKISFSLYDNRTELKCYQNGAYPFENRIDLIGYYYFINKTNFKKIHLKDFDKKININTNLNVNDFYDLLLEKISDSNILEAFKDGLTEYQVKSFVTNFDIARYLIKHLEKTLNGENEYYDFLDQVFEMYAPAWSPMPVKNHLDYWNGFKSIEKEIDIVALSMLELYKKYRNNIIKHILSILIRSRANWVYDTEALIKEDV
jgi:hypothetical protein